MNKERNNKPQFDPQEKGLLRIATKGGKTHPAVCNIEYLLTCIYIYNIYRFPSTSLSPIYIRDVSYDLCDVYIVVTLFNAISTRQREDQEEKERAEEEAANKREARKQSLSVNKLTNQGFLDLLKEKAGSNSSNTASQQSTESLQQEGQKPNSWNILTDSYMMSAPGVKDFDNILDSDEDEEEEEQELEQELEEESD